MKNSGFDIRKTSAFVSYSRKGKVPALIVYPPHKRVPHVHLNEFGFDEYLQKFSGLIDLLDLTHFFFGAVNCRKDKGHAHNKDIAWDIFIREDGKARIMDFLMNTSSDEELRQCVNSIGRLIPEEYEQYIFVLGFPKQTSMALCLAKYLKERGKKVIIARPILNSYMAIPARLRELLQVPFVDAVANSFENNIIDLISGKDPADIEDICYREGDRVRTGRPRTRLLKWQDMPSPQYRHLNKKDVRVIHYELSRGCANSCAYCVHSDQALNMRPLGAVIRDVKRLVKKFNCRQFRFLCTSINSSRPYVLDLCRQIAAAGLDITWSSYILIDRIDEGVATALRQAGCVFVDMGIESPAIGHLNANKIKTLEGIERNLAMLRKNRIKVNVSFILGSIDYKASEGEDIIRFLIRNCKNIDSVNLNRFDIHSLNVANLVRSNKGLCVSGKYVLDQRCYEFADSRFTDYKTRSIDVTTMENNIQERVEAATRIRFLHWEDFPVKKSGLGPVEAAHIVLFNE